MHHGTDSDTAAMPAPEGEVANFAHPERYLHTANKVVVIVGLVVSTLCLLVRGYTRVVVVRKLLPDDGVYYHSWRLNWLMKIDIVILIASWVCKIL